MIIDYQNQIRDFIAVLMNDPLFNMLLNPLGVCFGFMLISLMIKLVRGFVQEVNPADVNTNRQPFQSDTTEYSEPDQEPEPPKISQRGNYPLCDYCGRPYNFTRSTCEGCGAPYKFGQLG
jgi:hypothetical protein